MYKKIMCLLLFMGCGVFDQFNKPKINIDSHSSDFGKLILNQLNQDVIDQFELNYLSEENCTDYLIQEKVDGCISSSRLSL